MKNRTRVSIGLPVYNGEPFLIKTLESILQQTFEDFELIILDNASTDNTEQICRAYLKKDSRISYVRNNQNFGATYNYNRVFELSSSPYFKWAAANDVCAPDFLKRCVEALDHNPHAVLAFPKTTLIDECDNVINTTDRDLNLGTDSLCRRFFSTLSSHPLQVTPICGLIRRSNLARTRLIGNFLAADRVLLAELSLKGRFHEIPEYLFFRRKHQGNVGTALESLTFYDPKLNPIIVFPEWKVLREHLRTIKRAHVSFKDKVKLLGVVLQWAIFRGDIFFRQGLNIRKLPLKLMYGRQN